jgi:D-glycero-D-manno-heptose 1,7-bisphosphate phosphatase
MLYLFDVDGTLITSYMDNPDKDYNRWQLLPGRLDTLAALLTEGHQVVLVSNQGGVGWGFTSQDEARAKLTQVAGALGFVHASFYEADHMEITYNAVTDRERWRNDNNIPPSVPIFVCYDKDGARRKPNGRMIEQARAIYSVPQFDGVAAIDGTTVMIGDRPEDEQAAQAAGVEFIHAEQFFA